MAGISRCLVFFDIFADPGSSEMAALIALSVCAWGSNAAVSHGYGWNRGFQGYGEIFFAGISRFYCDGEVMQESALARSMHHRTFCRRAVCIFGIVCSVV